MIYMLRGNVFQVSAMDVFQCEVGGPMTSFPLSLGVLLSSAVIGVQAFSLPWHSDTPHDILDARREGAWEYAEVTDTDLINKLQGSIGPYTKKPDCFRRVVARIRGRCSDLEVDVDERVKAAVSMAVCELRTAESHSIPLECAPFLGDEYMAGAAHHGVCVEALSRSPQAWASYSGCLREIPQLCFAYERSNGRDFALEIYRNATMEKMAYMRHLMQHAKQEESMRTVWQTLLLDLQTSIVNLQASPSVVDRVYTDITERVLDDIQWVIRAQNEASDVQIQKITEHSLVLSDVSICPSPLHFSAADIGSIREPCRP
ncbi:hypothetical protein BC834DRAFT_252944 [Gloeopeniophorella convolvens]|nr:hypothetical protein BC834DRAFT_252944 [Gloeopeniophorella convolvens]